MGVAAAVILQQRIADIIQRRPVLGGRQRPESGAGEILKPHRETFWRAGVEAKGTASLWKNYTNGLNLPNVTSFTEEPRFFPFNGPAMMRGNINFRYRNNSLSGGGRSALPSGILRGKGLFVATPQIERNSAAPTRPTPQT